MPRLHRAAALRPGCFLPSGKSLRPGMALARIRGSCRGHTVTIPVPRAQNSNEFVIVHLFGCGMRALAT
jgi:hypothetical protein